MFTTTECSELDAAYDRGIELVEQLIEKQEETIRKLEKAKGREGDWEKLDLEIKKTEGKVKDIMRDNPVLKNLIAVEMEMKKIE